MNATSQAVTPELASKIAHLAVLFRAAFPDSQVDLSPWLTDAKTQSQLDPHSIDLSFYPPRRDGGLTCQCVFIQVHFSDNLLQSTCQLSMIKAHGYICTEQQWQFSTQDWAFTGLSTPKFEHQERFNRLIGQIFELFRHPDQVNNVSTS